MQSNSFLGYTSISQWALFLGIAAIIFGWVEKKEKFILIGQLTFLFLGFLALYVLLTDKIVVPQNNNIQIPKEMKVLSYFKSVAIFMGLDVISLLMSLFKIRFHKVSIYILVFFALMLFFMVFDIQQMAK